MIEYSSSHLPNKNEREHIANHPNYHGIDYIEFKQQAEDHSHYLLHIYFIPPAQKIATQKSLPTIRKHQLSITTLEGHHLKALNFDNISYDEERPNQIDITLTCAPSAAPPLHVPLVFKINHHKILSERSAIWFSLGLNNAKINHTASYSEDKNHYQFFNPPHIDYLAKDYNSLKTLLEQRLAVTLPEFTERNPCDSMIMLLEILAYAGDHLSYYQDAVAQESTLYTARNRISLKRHLQLLNYHLSDGHNSRVWLQVQINNTQTLTLPKTTRFVTALGEYPTVIEPDINLENLAAKAIKQDAAIYESMYETQLFKEHNTMKLYSFHHDNHDLEEGTTKAVLHGHYPHLKPGDALLFEEVIDPHTGNKNNANLKHRHVVTLTKVTLDSDPLGKGEKPGTHVATPITYIEWHAYDRLPYTQHVKRQRSGKTLDTICVVRGNMVLADEGVMLPGKKLTAFGTVNESIKLKLTSALAYSSPLPHKKNSPAKELLQQNQATTTPEIYLTTSQYDHWHPKKNLLLSNRFDKHFVVEKNDHDDYHIRFGNNDHGRQPSSGTKFNSYHRILTSNRQSTGAQSICHIYGSYSNAIDSLSNPIASTNNLEPEHTHKAISIAPKLRLNTYSCITPQDYAQLAQKFNTVLHATATATHEAGQEVITPHLMRHGFMPITAIFKKRLLNYIEPKRLIHHRIDIRDALYIPAHTTLVLHIHKTASPNTILSQLQHDFNCFNEGTMFSTHHADFGKTLYLSHIIAHIMSVSGVEKIDLDDSRTRFYHYNPRNTQQNIASGYLTAAENEVIRMSSIPTPHCGVINFIIEQQQ